MSSSVYSSLATKALDKPPPANLEGDEAHNLAVLAQDPVQSC